MKTLKIIVTVLLTFLGVVSTFMTLSVTFDWFGIRAIEGNYVPFVLYANMACGFIYLIALYLLWKGNPLASRLLWIALGVLIIAFIGLAVHINGGGIYETKTVKAMTFRTVITAFLAWATTKLLKQNKQLS